MKERFLKNWPLLIISLILSFIVWFAVIQATDPQRTRSFTLPVSFENEQIIADRGMAVTSIGTPEVTIRVTKARSIVNALSENDFNAVADYSKMYRDTQVPVTVTSLNPNINPTDIELRTASVEVTLESLREVTRVIEYETTGEPAAGYVVNSVTLEPDSVTVTCPESFVQYVRTAKVFLDVTGMSDSAVVNAQLKLFDGNDDEIDVDAAKNISWDTKGVIECSVGVKQVQSTPVTVSVVDTDKVAEGYVYSGCSVLPESIVLYGPRDVIAGFTEIRLDPISVGGFFENVTKEIDIRSLLPEGVEVYKDTTTAIVTLKIEKLEEKTVRIPSEQIRTVDVPEGLEAGIETAFCEVTVKGLPAALDAVDASDFTLSLDLEGLEAGTYIREPSVAVLAQDCELVSASAVTVTVAPEGGTEPAQEPSSADGQTEEPSTEEGTPGD